MKTVLDILAARLQQSTDVDLENCNRMYSATFRSAAPFPANMLESAEFSALARSAKITAYVEPEIGKCPAADWDSEYDDEYAADLWEARAEELLEFAPEVITGESLVVELCNYKGESEGFALFENAKHLPVFISKAASAAFFNC